MKFKFKTLHLKPLTSSRGFTLVEFIVIMVIFSIMAGVALFSFKGFNARVSLDNLAEDIALTIRQAQTFGISATDEAFNTRGAQTRGVYFPLESSGQYSKSFHLFADVGSAPNYHYDDTGSSDVILDTITIQTGDYIEKICVRGSGLGPNSGEVCDKQELHVAFTRPHPEAHMLSNVGGSQYASARIVIMSQEGKEKSILIWSTGHISVE